MMNSFEIRDGLLQILSLREDEIRETEKMYEFDLGAGCYCYVKRPYRGTGMDKEYYATRTYPLVIHKNWINQQELLQTSEIEIGPLYKNTNMGQFPRLEGSSTKIGLSVAIDNMAALRTLVGTIGVH